MPREAKFKTTNLVTALSQRKEADMNRYASSEILDCMLAFYKVRIMGYYYQSLAAEVDKQVAMKCLVDNVVIHAVEIILIQKLEGFLSTSRIIEMDPDLVQKIAAESPAAVHQQEQLSRKLEVWQKSTL